MLIVTVWALFLLGILAVAAGTQATRRLAATERIRGRMEAYAAARAGVAQAVAVLALDTNAVDALSERWADSETDFRAVSCGRGFFSVVRHMGWDGVTNTQYGVYDEEARVDINLAPEDVIESLLVVAGQTEHGQAHRLATNIVASRSTPALHPNSPPEPTPFLCTPELIGVAGVDESLFRRLAPYVTVHGGARVNLNTADAVVLTALLSRACPSDAVNGSVNSVVRKILQFREGGGMFATYVGDGVVAALSGAVDVDADERALLNTLSPVVTVTSERYRIVSEGESRGGHRFLRRVECVWNRATRRLESWNED